MHRVAFDFIPRMLWLDVVLLCGRGLGDEDCVGGVLGKVGNMLSGRVGCCSVMVLRFVVVRESIPSVSFFVGGGR